MRAVVILPTYNEKDNIEKIVKANFTVGQKLKDYQLHILVVDDNSPDGTADIVRKLQKTNKKLHLITGKKEGLGKAYLRGMKHASTKLKADVMFEMDADFSHDPKEIPNFLAKIDQGYDLVVGSRYMPGGSIPSNWGLHRKIMSVCANLIVRLALFNFGHKEWTNGYRAIKTGLYKKLAPQIENFTGYTFQVSFLHKAFLVGAKVGEIPIQFKDRVYGESKIGPEYIVNMLKYLILTNIQNPPRILRFLVVGTTGFLIQTAIFTFLWKSFGYDPALSTVIGAEFAIISNFILNNFWTFSDRKLKKSLPILIPKFLSFNVLSFGSPIIQWLTVRAATNYIGDQDLVTWAAYISGILIGLVWNYTVYNKIIWKKKS